MSRSGLPQPWYWRGAASTALTPASWAYAAAQSWRAGRRRQAAHEIPLVVVGNPRVGGSGKTPISIDAVLRLRTLGLRGAYIARGVGGDGRLTQVTDLHRASEVGDEAVMARGQLGGDCFAGTPRWDASPTLRRSTCTRTPARSPPDESCSESHTA